MLGEPISEVVRWHYWFLQPRVGEQATLLSQNVHDQTRWQRDAMTAVCRHDPSHRPPAAGCRCGIYGVNAVDIQFGPAWFSWFWDETIRRCWAAVRGEHNPLCPPPPAGSAEAKRLLRGLTRQRFSPDLGWVIGRMRHRGGVPVPPVKFGEPLQSWRGSSAVLDELFVDPAAAAHNNLDQVCRGLAARYGVPCSVGFPAYTQQDWDERTPTGGWGESHPGCPTHEDLGLRPPGVVAPPPRRYFHATV